MRDKFPILNMPENQELQHELDIQAWENEGGSISHTNAYDDNKTNHQR